MIATMPTLKPLPRPVVLPFDGVYMQAFSARLGRVGRVHQHRFNTVFNALVGNKPTELIERPTIRATAFCLASGLLIGAFTNTCQIFQRYRCALGFSGVDDAFADVVVQPGLIASLSARQPFQDVSRSSASRPCAFRGFLLKRCSHPGKLVSDAFDFRPRPAITFRGHSNVCTSQINADHLRWFDGIGRFVRQLNMKVEHAVLMLAELSRRRFTPLQLPRLVVSQDKRYPLSGSQKGQASGSILLSKVKDPRIIISRSGAELLNEFTLHFCRFAICSDTGTDPHRLIRAQPKLGSEVLIHSALNRGLAGYPWLDLFISVVAPIRKRFQQIIQLNDLLWRGLKLASDSESLFHFAIISQVKRMKAVKTARSFFLPALKRQGFQTYRLSL